MNGTLDLVLSLGLVALAAIFVAFRFARTLRRGKSSCCSDSGQEVSCSDPAERRVNSSSCADCGLKERCCP